MQLQGKIQINAPRARVWEALNDTGVLSRCIPGCERVDAVGPTERTAHVVVKVGPVRARFSGNLRMEDVEPDVGCVMRFEGSGGAAGMAKGHSVVRLADLDDGATCLSYTAEASVGGKLGQVGGRMIDAAAQQMASEFFRAFDREVGASAEARRNDGAPVAAAVPPAPGTPPIRPVPADMPSRPAVHPVTPVAPSIPERVRLVWFLMGALSTGLGIWLGARVFS